MAYNVLLLVYVILQFIAFLLVLVATPMEMFRQKDVSPDGSFFCYTLWGFKFNCRSLDYDVPIHEVFTNCPVLLHRFRAAQAFAIISIFVYGAAFILGLILLFCSPSLRMVCLALNIVGIATLCVVWAAMAVTYNTYDGPQCLRVNIFLKYGAGFVLFVIAWILDIINTVILLLPCTVTDSDEDKHKQPAAGE
ncbi:uncharacterized protein [Leishmania mexicana MHOM/GT/2001/U1103]|uniref:Amastin-like surface protein n=1 Tax=Leishmania mexicana (strain MHOM/GT/2001/U1103) TaxID=929439 RepID=E8NHI5_LEIMU|nr:uncharacterized protein [Leishmania mexicana MHOM/GT/2001/U1103]CBZ40960.1 unnamed protein product [Leishmania mexicana MHOM/GT/2001/U1103]